MRIKTLRETPRNIWAAYLATYIIIGFGMNEVGRTLAIAQFANWWQVITCYGFYLVPVSLVVAHKSAWDQYLWGLFALSILEFCGYAFETSIAFEGNIIETWFGTRNFSLAMTIFFASYIPLGNALMRLILDRLTGADYRPSNSKRLAIKHSSV